MVARPAFSAFGIPVRAASLVLGPASFPAVTLGASSGPKLISGRMSQGIDLPTMVITTSGNWSDYPARRPS